MTSTNVPGGAGPPKADLTSDDYKHTINQACVLAIADLESSDTSMLCGLSCLYDRLNLNGACKGNIPVIVKTLAAAAQIDLDTAQQRVAWAFKNGVEIDYEL